MNKDSLLELLKTKYGDSIDLSLITDDDVTGLIPEPSIPTTEPEIDSEDVEDLIPPINIGDDDSGDADELDLDDIDESQLDDNGKILLRVLRNDRKKLMQEKLKNIVTASQVDETSKSMLNKMIKLGISEEELNKTISDITETMNKKKRASALGGKSFGKGQLRDKTSNTKTDDKPKIGSKAFGAFLASK